MENNKVITLNKDNKPLSVEELPSAEAAYEYYTDSIRILNSRLPKGETVTIIRMRWGSIMAMETITGKN